MTDYCALQCQAHTHKLSGAGLRHGHRSSNFANCDAEKWTHQVPETASDSLARNGIGGKPTRSSQSFSGPSELEDGGSDEGMGTRE
jgi:hypothetical protein